MKIKIVCQLCGKQREMDTEELLGSEPRWNDYPLEQFDITKEESPFWDYHIWICGKCHEPYIVNVFTGYDEDGSTYSDIEWDWDALTSMVLDSFKEN